MVANGKRQFIYFFMKVTPLLLAYGFFVKVVSVTLDCLSVCDKKSIITVQGPAGFRSDVQCTCYNDWQTYV